jgi:hypothetical protein
VYDVDPVDVYEYAVANVESVPHHTSHKLLEGLPAVHDHVNLFEPATTDVMVGGFEGVDDADSAEYEPTPDELIPATRNVYAVPFVKPVTVALRLVLTPSTKVVQVPAVQY